MVDGVPAVAAVGLVKRYGTTVALDGLGFEFPSQRLVGFLGPNGAGKTTTFRSILGLARLERGTIDVLGMRLRERTADIVKRVGAIVEEPGVYPTLNAVDNLRVAALTLGAGAEQIPALLRFVGLSAAAERKVAGYSKGMRQRLGLAAAMLGDPDLLLLDEPMDGLDPAGQVALRAQLRSLVEERGKTVVVSSHVLADVEQLADHIVVIHRGQKVADGALEELVGSTGGFRVVVDDPVRAAAVLSAEGIDVRAEEGALYVAADDGRRISRSLAAAGLYPAELVPRRVTLEEVFLELTREE